MKLSSETLLALAFCSILAILVIPLPPVLLDLLISVSLTVSILVLLLAIHTERPLDFSVFPSLLLMVTLLRLGLNVATTRLILLHGADGAGAAGNVIKAFGDFTVGGDPTVGIILFAIFAVINFVVITKGAGRIAEVAARFTLDAMPGKQMAIDADLSQGMVDDSEARRRRKEVQREADFYGAMDGASKFVRGDAIAGVLIMFVNILGGLLLGVVSHGLPLAEAFHTYTILTVGDGLVTQVPALIVSTAAGVVVSRAAAGAPLADELRTQLFGQPRALAMAGGMLGAMSLVPGLPFLPFAALAGGAFALARGANARKLGTADAAAPSAAPAISEETEIRQALNLDELELEIGYGLIPLVDPARGGELAGRIRATRRQLASELGFVVPLVHIRDNLTLPPGGYRILLRGNTIAQREIPTGRLLAIAPGGGAEKLPGIPGQDPAFGLPALWIQERDRERASTAGYAVVDAATAITTHLAEVVRGHASDLLSRQHVRDLLDQLAERMPRLVDDIVPAIVSLSVLHRTLRQLLSERVSIRDLATILETLAEYAARIQDPDLLTDLVRERLSRTIVRDLLGDDGSLHVLTLDPEIEEKLRGSVQRSESGSFLALDAASLSRIVGGIEKLTLGGALGARGSAPALICSPVIRSGLRQVLSRTLPRLPVLSHSEIPAEIRLVGDGVVR